jgi:hypothetical protein
MTARAVVTSMPSMRVKSTPHILNSWVRRSNFGALRGRLRFLPLAGSGRLQTLMRFDLLVALGQLRADEVERCQRLLETNARLTLQALGDLIDAGADAHVLHDNRGQTIMALR